LSTTHTKGVEAMSKLSRRSAVLPLAALVTTAAALPALAVPALANVAKSPFEHPGDHPDWIAAVRLPAVGDTSQAACAARAEYIVHVLGDRYIHAGWHESFDRSRAAQFIKNVRTFDEDDGADPRFIDALQWMKDHNQDIGWLFHGDPAGMICGGAKVA
jgi:hypothetical protein